MVAACGDVELLKAWWEQTDHPAARAAIEQRVAEIQAQVSQMPQPEDDGGSAA